jgi:hypothetical protein
VKKMLCVLLSKKAKLGPFAKMLLFQIHL